MSENTEKARDLLDQAREMIYAYHRAGKDGPGLDEFIARLLAQARLEEALWWHDLAHNNGYVTVGCCTRIRELKLAAGGTDETKR